MSKIKKAWDDYGGLIMAVGGVVSIICTAAVFVGGLYLNSKIDARIKLHTGANISLQVGLNTDAVNDLESSINGLDESIKTLNTDVKDTLRILANQ